MTPRESLLAAIAAANKYESAKDSIAKINYQDCFDLLSDAFAATLIAIRDHGPALLAALDDAERYRWLREFDPLATKCVFLTNSRDDLDAAIDAARKA